MFLHFLVLCIASCLGRVNLYGRSSMGFSGVVSLILCLNSLGLAFLLCGLSCCTWVFTCWWFLCWWVLSSSRFTGVHNSHLIFYVINLGTKMKLISIPVEYSMTFKVPTHREEIGNTLDMYSDNHDISPK